jgi:hypothetical protein
VSEYLDFVRNFEADVTNSISSTVPQARVITSFRIAYGGRALQVPANRADDLLEIAGIVAVQRDELSQPLTDTTPEFIGATEAWGSLGVPLYPHNVGKLRSHVLRYGLKARDLAVSEIRRGTPHCGSNLLPPTHGRGNVVSEGTSP